MSRMCIVALAAALVSCAADTAIVSETGLPEPDFVIDTDQTHTKFSRAIPPAIRVPSGSVVEAHTHEATGGQLRIDSTVADFENVDMDRVHTLTGPIYVEGAEPGDTLSVTLLELEPGDWGWTGMGPHFGFLSDENTPSAFKTYALDKKNNLVRFTDGVNLPLKPFAGVMGVAPDTDEMLVTIPPRANGGNMDDPNIGEGVTVYFPVFVEGALFSIGDTHAAQGDGEVSGTAVEAPMRIVLELRVVDGARPIPEPQYETDEYYAVTAFAETLDEAARKATRYMIDYLVEEHGMDRTDAYVLCSLAGDLKIAEVVDVPHVLVSMHMPKAVLGS